MSDFVFWLDGLVRGALAKGEEECLRGAFVDFWTGLLTREEWAAVR